MAPGSLGFAGSITLWGRLLAESARQSTSITVICTPVTLVVTSLCGQLLSLGIRMFAYRVHKVSPDEVIHQSSRFFSLEIDDREITS